MGSKHKIIQWNCRGLRPHYEEYILLLTLLRPSVFCLPETYLKAEDTFTFKGFNTYNHIHSDCLSASGGSSIFVNFLALNAKLKCLIDCLFEIRKIEVCFLWILLPGDYRVTDEALLAETT